MSGDAAKGQVLFKKYCLQCHEVVAGQPHKQGPNLFGIVGRAAGTAAGYSYSNAMKNSGVEWNETTLSEYVANPKKYIPGNKMVYAGMKKKKDIDNLVAYLAAQN